MRATTPELLVFAYRFLFIALDALHIPAGQGGNLIRGALGTTLRRIACAPLCHSSPFHHDDCVYSRLFAPRLIRGPSGIADPPRPFVLRAAELGGKVIEAGEHFHFDLHLFTPGDRALEHFALAFAELAKDGLGPARARVLLTEISALNVAGLASPAIYNAGKFTASDISPIRIPLAPDQAAIDTLKLQFLTPTELKHHGIIIRVPEFGILFSRLRARVASLLSLYGARADDLDLAGLGERANAVKLLQTSLIWHEAERRSSRTGQTHPLGGFTGSAIYEGNFAEFLPWLRAGSWTGVGRQTVWGKGKIAVDEDK